MTLACIVFLTLSGISSAQSSKIADAFSKSYLGESNKEYLASIVSIENVYDATSFAMNLRLGWLHYLNKEYSRSQSYYNKAITLEPKSVDARLGYINAAAALQNWDEVLKTYKDILTFDPNNSLVNYRVGYIYYYRKNFTEAEKHLLKVVQMYPFDFDTNFLLGSVYVGQGKIVEAKRYYQLAQLYNPASKDVTDALAKL
jgi:tetratricopeptide (TPR) repeat protein